MPHAKTLEKEANVRRVLDVALNNFYCRGIEQTKLADIAAEAGVTPMSIHRYFGDKCTLVLQAGNMFWSKFAAGVADACKDIEAPGSSGFRQVSAMLELTFRIHEKYPRVVIWVQDFESYIHAQVDAGKLPQTSIEKYRQQTYAPLYAALEKGIKDGSIRCDVPIDTLYHTIMSFIYGVMYRSSMDVQSFYPQDASAPEAQLSLCLDMILSYIAV